MMVTTYGGWAVAVVRAVPRQPADVAVVADFRAVVPIAEVAAARAVPAN